MAREVGRELTEAERAGLVVPDEDRPHIFWNCTTVASCIQDVCQGVLENEYCSE
jgi:hypothetical protein